MAIRKIETIHSLTDLGLELETLRTLKAMDINVQDLITAARNDQMWRAYSPERLHEPEANQLTRYAGIGEARAKEITEAVDEAGFILHESEASRNIRRFVVAVVNDPQVFNSHYEYLDDLSPEAIAAAKKVVRDNLNSHEREIIENYFGLGDGRCRTISECAGKLGVTQVEAEQLLNKSLAMLRENSIELKVITRYSREALSSRISDLRYSLNGLELQLKV